MFLAKFQLKSMHKQIRIKQTELRHPNFIMVYLILNMHVFPCSVNNAMKLTLKESKTSIHCCFSSGLEALRYQTQSLTDTSNLQSSNS